MVRMMYGFKDNLISFIMKYYAGMNPSYKRIANRNTGPYEY